jgi:hypothetical protein
MAMTIKGVELLSGLTSSNFADSRQSDQREKLDRELQIAIQKGNIFDYLAIQHKIDDQRNI